MKSRVTKVRVPEVVKKVTPVDTKAVTLERLLTWREMTAVYMAKWGYANNHTLEVTRISRHRLEQLKRRFGIKLSDHRNGRTKESVQIVEIFKSQSVNYVDELLSVMKTLPAQIAQSNKIVLYKNGHKTILDNKHKLETLVA